MNLPAIGLTKKESKFQLKDLNDNNNNEVYTIIISFFDFSIKMKQQLR